MLYLKFFRDLRVIRCAGQHRHTKLYRDPRFPAELKERTFVKFATPHQVYHAIRGRILGRTFTTNTRRPEINKNSLYIYNFKNYLGLIRLYFILFILYIFTLIRK